VLKDIAAMGRSFDYARIVATRQFAAKTRSGAADVSQLLDDWRVHVNTEFRAAYRNAIADCGVWPRDEDEVERLLHLATIERLLYEIRYELTHRPELVAVPLADLTALTRT
jgi:predicted trehalose synthase